MKKYILALASVFLVSIAFANFETAAIALNNTNLDALGNTIEGKKVNEEGKKAKEKKQPGDFDYKSFIRKAKSRTGLQTEKAWMKIEGELGSSKLLSIQTYNMPAKEDIQDTVASTNDLKKDFRPKANNIYEDAILLLNMTYTLKYIDYSSYVQAYVEIMQYRNDGAGMYFVEARNIFNKYMLTFAKLHEQVKPNINLDDPRGQDLATLYDLLNKRNESLKSQFDIAANLFILDYKQSVLSYIKYLSDYTDDEEIFDQIIKFIEDTDAIDSLDKIQPNFTEAHRLFFLIAGGLPVKVNIPKDITWTPFGGGEFTVDLCEGVNKECNKGTFNVKIKNKPTQTFRKNTLAIFDFTRSFE